MILRDLRCLLCFVVFVVVVWRQYLFGPIIWQNKQNQMEIPDLTKQAKSIIIIIIIKLSFSLCLFSLLAFFHWLQNTVRPETIGQKWEYKNQSRPGQWRKKTNDRKPIYINLESITRIYLPIYPFCLLKGSRGECFLLVCVSFVLHDVDVDTEWWHIAIGTLVFGLVISQILATKHNIKHQHQKKLPWKWKSQWFV